MNMTAEQRKAIEDQLDRWFHEYVPTSGPAKTVGGEIVRAMERLLYRWYNDGDKVGYLYGNITCNGSYAYLVHYMKDLPILDGSEQDDEEYDVALYDVADIVVSNLQTSWGYFQIANDGDSREVADSDYAREREQEREAFPEEFCDEEEEYDY